MNGSNVQKVFTLMTKNWSAAVSCSTKIGPLINPRDSRTMTIPYPQLLPLNITLQDLSLFLTVSRGRNRHPPPDQAAVAWWSAIDRFPFLPAASSALQWELWIC